MCVLFPKNCHAVKTMSNVRLSNGSPTLERMDAARLSDQPKPSACRTLFGPVDHEELKRELTGHLKAMEEAAAESWGFDFSTHTPRPNARFLWKAVDSKDLPSFYSASEQPSKSLCAKVDVNGNCGLTEEREDKSEKQTDRTDKRKRPACIDSSCPSKRSRTCLDETPHTPKKCSPPRHT
ncbi:hypothetical protein PHYPO_G00246020 [Pangasianodon hypophthalmus]|uniref:Cyclin-dependent kinase inhibitor 1B n=2 Tax=Pangasianodon TaxID=30992 RepID=A0A5N5NEZ2_PANHP|nr:cyclin-dependent kinase inhibitor 1Bb [Pangasianodon hypophthalmus]KAB5565832.1 hypothetical protein PHYPO_G00246020 [Pangasianodon hypophthalmus]MCI4381982.1 hypothetical protein [Pangasianodon gigas]